MQTLFSKKYINSSLYMSELSIYITHCYIDTCKQMTCTMMLAPMGEISILTNNSNCWSIVYLIKAKYNIYTYQYFVVKI